MTKDQPEFCWHHGNLERLHQCLDKGYCDLYEGERGIKWYDRHRLYKGMLVRFSVKGEVVAFGTIQSEPYDLFSENGIEPVDPKWSGAVKIDDVRRSDGGYCNSYPRRGSHKL